MAEPTIIPIVKPAQPTLQQGLAAGVPVPQAVQNAINNSTQPTSAFKGNTVVVELPSKGWFYPENSPLSSGKVTIKEMTAKEEDILSNQKFVRNGTVLSELLKSVIVDPVNCLDDLLVGDKNAIFFATRIAAYGKDYKVKVKCPSCGEENDVTIDLSKLKNKDFDFSGYTRGVNEFKYTLPNSGRLITYRLLTHKDETAIDTELKSLEKFSKNSSTSITTRLKYILTSVDGKADKGFIKSFVDNELSSKDSLELRTIVRNSMPDFNSDFEFICSSCDHSEKMATPLNVSFLWPSNE